jgi:hypothetical protein
MAYRTRLARSRVRDRSRRRHSRGNTCERPPPIPARPSSGRDLRRRRSKPRHRGRSDLCPFPGSVPFAHLFGQRAPTLLAGHSGTVSRRLGRVGHFPGAIAESRWRVAFDAIGRYAPLPRISGRERGGADLVRHAGRVQQSDDDRCRCQGNAGGEVAAFRSIAGRPPVRRACLIFNLGSCALRPLRLSRSAHDGCE